MVGSKNGNGSFAELVKQVQWDGLTATFRFAQLSPTLLLVSGTELPPHYHPCVKIDEYWMVLSDSNPVEISTSNGLSISGDWTKTIIGPGEYIYIPGDFSRSARAVGRGSFHLLMSLSEPASRTPMDQQRRLANSR